MKKSRILTFLLICLPLLVAIGFSSWIIIYEVVFSPTYQENPLSEIYGFSQSTTYNGEEQVPEPLNGETIDGTISYQYKLEGESEDKLVEGNGPIDAGVYDVIITVTGNDAGVCQVKFTINKKKIKLEKTLIQLNYSECQPYWESMGPTIENDIGFLDSTNQAADELVSGDYYINGMHNGVYYYGLDDYTVDGLTTTTNIAGSTYICEVNLHETLVDNYEFIGSNTITIKYKTVNVEGTLYTIEDAINVGSGTITLLGSESEYIETCFSKILPTKSYTINNSRKLLLPYKSGSGDFERTYNNSLTGIYSTLMIPEGITITLTENSKSSIIVGSIIDQVGTVERHSVLMNNGTINIYNSCQIGAYGYIKGTGLINVYNGAEAVDVFRLYDWPGAGSALTLKGANAFPVKEWSVYNISCKTRVYKGGLYNSISYIVALSGLTKIKVDDIYIIGNDSTNNCLFKPSSSSTESDYVEKSATITNDGYNVSNQVKTTMNNVTIHGDYIDASVKVNASGYAFQTSTSMAVPINYYNITISENSKLVLAASSYIFLSAKSNITIKKNATLDVNGSAYLVMLNSSSLIMDEQGSTLGGTGTFGGKIVVNAEKSVLKIKNYDKYTTDDQPAILKTGSETYANQESIATGNVKVGSEYKTNQTFTDSYLYISEAYGGSYYYVGASEEEYNTYRINYNTNGGDELESDIIPSFDSTYTVTLDSLQVPHKDYYTLESWYTDENCTEGNEFTGTTLTASNATLNLYAKWKYKEYSFSYMVAYEDSNNDNYLEYLDNNTVLSNLNGKFTYETLQNGDLTISTTATYGDKTFYGWYVGFDEANGILVGNTFKLSYLQKIVAEEDVDQIPLYAVFKDYKEYTIIFVDNNDDFSDPSNIKVQTYGNIALPDTSSYDDDPNNMTYCKNWYYTSNKTTGTQVINNVKLSSILDKVTVSDGNTIYLYADFVTKDFTVKYKNASGQIDESLTQYFNEGQVFDLSSSDNIVKSDYDNGSNIIKYTFEHWVIEDTNSEVNDSSTFTGNTVLVPYFSESKYCTITVSATNSTISNSYNSSTNENIEYVPIGTKITFSVSYGGSYDKSFVVAGENISSDSKEVTVNNHISVTAYSSYTCLAAGTLITMSNGSVKKIEDIKSGDKVLAFNHETGLFVEDIVSFNAHMNMKWNYYQVIKLNFSSNYVIEIISEHGFFDLTVNKYIYIDSNNYDNYIGHKFLSTNVKNGHIEIEEVILETVELYEKYTGIYCPISTYNINTLANGLLTVAGGVEGIINIFEYDSNLKYDEEKMQNDINKYGLFEYEDFAEYITFEQFEHSPLKYYKVAISKGKITFEQLLKLIVYRD